MAYMYIYLHLLFFCSRDPCRVLKESQPNIKELFELLVILCQFCVIFSSPGQRPCELLPSLGVRRTSNVGKCTCMPFYDQICMIILIPGLIMTT
jgi:hypothetical protein